MPEPEHRATSGLRALHWQSPLRLWTQWWAGVTGVALAVFAFVAAKPLGLPPATYVPLAVAAVVLPPLLSWGHTAYLRAHIYGDLYRSAQSAFETQARAEREADELKSDLAAWLRFLTSLEQSGVINVIDVAGYILLDGELRLVLGHQYAPSGSVDRIAVVNSISGELLGWFEVVGNLRGKYLAREIRIWNPVWWGFVHDQAERQVMHGSSVSSVVAILLPREG